MDAPMKSAWSDQSCPFLALEKTTGAPKCTGANSRRQASYCTTENYDNCPLFLARLLRNSRPKFRGVLDLSLK